MAAAKRLPHYLNTFRKRSGLSLNEIAHLLGNRDGAQFHRYETYQRVPPLDIAFALSAIFKVPIEDLFAGIRESAKADIPDRMAAVACSLKQREIQDRVVMRKLSWIADNHGPVEAESNAALCNH
ncbi:MAG TPA: helix-turn-helix transcriptional regulator [Candidatus Angelobacter sp.]|nr:helix-turn-helix transcriptional regulator [Candidatus Angelobacter sp.]